MLTHVEDRDLRDWKSRAYYYATVQPAAFASGHCDPLLMGNPLVPAVLRKMKIYNVDATFHVKADGTITSVEMKPGELSPDMEKTFSAGFQRGCLFVPAVDNGKFVDGTYEYHMEGIAPSSPAHPFPGERAAAPAAAHFFCVDIGPSEAG